MPNKSSEDETPIISHNVAYKVSELLLEDVDDNIVALIDALEAIDENKPSSKLKEISMTDSKSRLIYY